jgi:hypothetical protein
MSNLKAAAIGAAVAAIVATSAVALAGSGVGGVFNLGQSNSVDAQSILTGNAGLSAQLKLENTGGGAAFSAVVNPGVTPFRVSNGTKVANLNSDLLDGKNSSDFLPSKGDVTLASMAADARAMSAGLTLTFDGFAGATVVHSSASGDKSIFLPITVPDTLFGTVFKVKSMTVCYQDSSPASFITTTVLAIRRRNLVTPVINDPTDRTATGQETCYDTVTQAQTPAVDGALYAQLDLHFASTFNTITIVFVKVTLTT